MTTVTHRDVYADGRLWKEIRDKEDVMGDDNVDGDDGGGDGNQTKHPVFVLLG